MAILLLTFRAALRAPSSGIILLGTVLLAWAGMTLGILTLDDQQSRVGELVAATCEMGACVLLLVVLARESSPPGESHWPEAALVASSTGAWGTWAWRSAGAAIAASSCFVAAAVLLYVLCIVVSGPVSIYVLYTTVIGLTYVVPELICLAAWVGALRTLMSGPASLVSGFALLVAARTAPGALLAGILPLSLSSTGAWGGAPERLALEVVSTAGLALLVASIHARARAR